MCSRPMEAISAEHSGRLMPSPARELLLGSMTEREFQRWVVTVAKRNGWLVSAMHDSRQLWWGADPGVPDLVFVRGDRVVFAELKSMHGRMTRQQKHWYDALLASNVEVYLWYPDMEVDVRRVLE